MVKLIGKEKLKTAIFISGRGSNLKSLYKFSKKKKSPIIIKLIVTDNEKAQGLIYAKNKKLKIFKISYSKKRDAEKKIQKILKKNNIHLICLAGFMKILSISFIKSFAGKILNIHPSLLPKYKGLNTHKRVLCNKEKFSGCTVHLVNNKLDSGKIILQKKVKVLKNDNEYKLSRKILKVEHKLYPAAITKLFFNY
ncbi:MAG: phosphoribosylglycinamide formyltransferase [Candidatus Pelagibacter sp.]